MYLLRHYHVLWRAFLSCFRVRKKASLSTHALCNVHLDQSTASRINGMSNGFPLQTLSQYNDGLAPSFNLVGRNG